MTETEQFAAAMVAQHETERAERPVLRREFAAELTAGDGRTVDVRIVPYGETITHNDGFGDVRDGIEYREEWLPGVFDHQLNAPNRIHANVEHEQGVMGKVGHGLVLRSDRDGFYGTFRLLETPAGETAYQLIKAGSLDGISLEARPVKNIKSPAGVIQRAKANLFGVAFTRFAAYAGARVLAVREEAITTLDAELLPVAFPPELASKLERSGHAVPASLKAHPAETGTPSDEGTPEGGTRHDGNQPEVEESSNEHNPERA